MKNLIIGFLAIIFTNYALAESKISDQVESLINKTDSNLNIGIKVKNLATNQVVYEKNSKRYFMPGSSLKFITIVSLLEHFGPDYQFTSRVLKQGNNYYIDIHHPNFSYEDLKLMIARISEDSGNQVKGNIYIVNNEFSVPAIMREKTISDTIYCNGALITKVHLDKNCARANVKPGKVGQGILVKSNKNFPYNIENNAKTVGKNKLDRLHVDIEGDKYVINGTLSKAYGLLPIGAVTSENFKNVIQHVKKGLSLRGTNVHGKITVGKAPKAAKTIYSLSISYKDAADRAMKISDNFMTDYFLAEYATQNKFSEWRAAIASVKHLIARKFNVDLRRSEIHDASGISRRNLLTVEQISDFLTSVHKSKNYETVKSLMACPGDDCTLRERFKGVKDLYTKTGTLRHVSSLMGYFKDKSGQEHSFVIMANNFYSYNDPYRKLEEEIVRLFMER